MKTITIILSTFLIFCGQIKAQNKISGKILTAPQNLTAPQKPAEFATVALLNAKDSSMVKANLTDLNGKYEFEGIKTGKYLIAGSMVGYKRTFSPLFEVNGESVQVPDIQLVATSKELSEVTVTAQKPFLEQRTDK
nr:carboxypeptidase-like regulatory domain-containing protein [Arcicella sp.]